MGNLFGVRRRTPHITEQDKAILQLKQQRDKIKVYQKRTETELSNSRDLAIKLYNEKKTDRALTILQRKKLLEGILTRTDKQLETLEGLVADIEFSQIQVSVVEGSRVGWEAIRQLNSLISIGDVEKILEETAEGAEKQREISRLLETVSERVDTQELLDELETYRAHSPVDLQDNQVNLESDKHTTTPAHLTIDETPKEETKTPDIDKQPTKAKTEPLSFEQLPDIPDIPAVVTQTITESAQSEEEKEEGKVALLE